MFLGPFAEASQPSISRATVLGNNDSNNSYPYLSLLLVAQDLYCLEFLLLQKPPNTEADHKTDLASQS